MGRFRPVLVLAAALALPLGVPLATGAVDDSSQTLTIGVDHFDPANQQIDPVTHQPVPGGRLFSYTDFFSRAVTVHTGDTLKFQAAGAFHVIAVAPDESSRSNLASADEELAAGTGGPRIKLGPVLLSALGPPSPTVCGFGPNPACAFTGWNVVFTAIAGQASWSVQVNAVPGSYSYFCYIHPRMSGKLKVIPSGHHTSTQSQINRESQRQFLRDQRDALKAEAAAKEVTFTGDEPGSRTYVVHGGVNSPGNHVSILEMLPAHLDLVQGDRVRFVMQNNEPHSFTFPSSHDEQPFQPDCGPPDVLIAPPPGPGAPPTCGDPGSPEFIADPGVSPSGTALTNPAASIDSGLLLGAGYGLPGPTSWTATTNANTVPTAANAYSYHCVLHDFMQGTIDVAAAPSQEG